MIPILLWTGDQSRNRDSGATLTNYSSLKTQKKKAVEHDKYDLTGFLWKLRVIFISYCVLGRNAMEDGPFTIDFLFRVYDILLQFCFEVSFEYFMKVICMYLILWLSQIKLICCFTGYFSIFKSEKKVNDCPCFHFN